MGDKEDRDIYRSLPKKELQDLCRKYGLSPYKAKPNLVESLNSYFEKKNLSSPSPLGSSSVNSTSLMRQMRFEAESSHIVDASKESYGIITCPKNEDNIENDSPTVQYNGLGSRVEAENDKAVGFEISEDCDSSMYDIHKMSPLASKKVDTSVSSKEVGKDYLLQTQHQNLNNGACLPNNAFASSVDASSSVPTFEYYVRSEDGIFLLVDLNSSWADWYNSLANDFNMSQTVHENKFQSFREELEHLGNCNKLTKSSFLGDTDPAHGMDAGHVKLKSSSDSRKTSSDVIEAFENSEEGKEKKLFSCFDSEVPNELITAVDSVEIQFSEVADDRKDSSFSPNENTCFLGVVDTKLSGKNSLAFAEQLEMEDHGNEMETSELFHLNNSLEKRLVDSVSDDGSKKKSKDNEFHNRCAQSEGKILRSSKRLAGEVLPRRSLRLVSKVAIFIGEHLVAQLHKA